MQRALKNQGLEVAPNRLKEVWFEGDYKYTVRIHEGNSKYTNANSIYRVSRQSTILDEHGQGTGLEYLGTDVNWYHESVLTEFFKGGTSNPNFFLDEAEDDKVKIIFEQPHMVSCNFFFTYEGNGIFISIVDGEEAYKINKMYGVTQGNIIFKITNINVETDMIIIAKNLEVQII